MFIKEDILVPIYEIGVTIVYFDESEKKEANALFKNLLGKKKYIPNKAYGLTAICEIEGYAIFVNISKHDNFICLVNTLVHECLHLMNMIYIEMGIEYDMENDEPSAYLMSWLVGKSLEIFHKNKLEVVFEK